jgi:hypothetical protein
MALGLTQPLTEMSTRNISWGRGGGGGAEGSQCVSLTALPLSLPDCIEIWEPHPPGTLRPVQTCNGMALPLQDTPSTLRL